ncbi:partial serine protease, partial [Anaerolineae bacterium]
VLTSTTTQSPENIQPTATSTLEVDITLEVSATEMATTTFTVTPATAVTPESLEAPVLAALPHTARLPGEYSPDEILVRFKKSASEESILRCLSSWGAVTLYTIEELNVQVVQVSSGKVSESIAVISSCPEVRYAEPNYTVSIADTIPSDPGLGAQYGLVNIRAPQGWDYSTGSSSVTIAILDTGVDLGHADLAGKIVPGYDFVNDDSVPQDDNGHGTYAAGIAAAIGNNGVGVAGVSWGARIMPVKVLNAGGGGFFADTADGIVWATDYGAQIINLSLGGVSPSTVLQDAVDYAYGKGVLLVAAAGNDNGTIRYPARYPNVVAVGAVDGLNNRAWNSNYGAELDLVAPGVNIYSTTIGGYGYDSGTSMAAPYVSGLAAILYGIPGNGSSALVTSQMESSALDLGPAGFDVYHGFGLIQMDSAIKMAIPTMATPTQEFVSSQGDPANINESFFMPGATPLNTIGTNTNTPTASLTLDSSTLAPSPTTTQPANSTTPSPEVQALSIQQEQNNSVQSSLEWQLPCAGIAFLLAGLLLLWTVRKKR